jgi:RNA polymerase sigma-70 factor (ECF subfamily)
MSAEHAVAASSSTAAVEAFTAALPEVYGYLVRRCNDRWLAEDLTSEAFTAAVSALERGLIDEVTTAWLTVVARRRLIDHWRRSSRVGPSVSDVALEIEPDPMIAWEEPMDVVRCRCALARLAGHHRAALTLRYLDGLSVGDVAREIGRGYEATEALLYRARAALRRAYEEELHHG